MDKAIDDVVAPRPSRRGFLALTGVSAAAFAYGIQAPAHAADETATGVPADPFRLGVASGDPSPDGVVLWTRLAPNPLEPDGHGGMPRKNFIVQYEVAADAGFRRVVKVGVALATPELGHSVHPEVRGLEPGREYFYRFRVGRELSPVGRTRTAPARDAMPSELRFVTASCQAWYHGYFTAHEHMLAEDPELVLFLGDYIYEYGITGSNFLRQGAQLPPDEHAVDVHTLEQYRLRYSLFKTEPSLQALHAACPWVLTTDDHEVANNYADEVFGLYPPEHVRRRRAVAYRAYYENVPLRSAQWPSGPDLPLYRRLHHGRLAQFDVVDTRQHRGRPNPCGAGISESCAEREDPTRTILGWEQEAWLEQGLKSSDAVWNGLVQQTILARIDRTPDKPADTFSNDQWDGFPAAQQRLYDAYRRHGIENPVSFPGDIHRHVAINLKADYLDPDSKTIGVEVGGGSITSAGDGAPTDSLTPLWLGNPHVRFYHGQRGYLSCKMTPQEFTSEFRVMPYVSRPGAPIETARRFVTEADNPGLQEA